MSSSTLGVYLTDPVVCGSLPRYHVRDDHGHGHTVYRGTDRAEAVRYVGIEAVEQAESEARAAGIRGRY